MRMTALCGQRRVLRSPTEAGIEAGWRGVAVVGAWLTMSVMRVGTFIGRTLSMRVNAGRRRTVVGSL
jgi:hypothetical protein